MKIKNFMVAAALAVGTVGTAHATTYTYVGSWSVGDGPTWFDSPPVYSGQEAAALLFGGSASQYAISTAGTDAASINFQAHVDGWGDETYLFEGGPTVSQSYKLDTGGFGYNSNPGTSSAFSAYVNDHSNPGDPNTVNYAFRIDGAAVPEPASWALMIGGLAMTGVAMRRRKTLVAA